MIKEYVSKPEELLAIQITSDNTEEILRFSDNTICKQDGYWGFVSNRFSQQFKEGDYVIKRNNYPCTLMKKELFEESFIEKQK